MKIRITDHKLNELLAYQNQLTAPQVDALRAGNEMQDARQFAHDPHLGQFLQRFLMFEHFSIVLLVWQLDQELEVYTEKLSSTVNMNFMLSGSIHSEFQALPHNICMNKMEHNLLFTSDSTGLHLFPAGCQLHNLHISFEKDYFKRIGCAGNPIMDKMLNSMERDSPALASACNGPISHQMLQAIRAMQACPFTGVVQQLYLEAKVLELLALQLHSLEQVQAYQKTLTQQEITLAEELKLYLDKHFLELTSLQQLTRQFATNEFKLKKVFREKFGGGIFAYVQRLRLDLAQELIASGEKNVSETAELLGYSHVNHFSNAFRKCYGYPPSQASKQYRPPRKDLKTAH